jgi:hypothetical protein
VYRARENKTSNCPGVCVERFCARPRAPNGVTSSMLARGGNLVAVFFFGIAQPVDCRLEAALRFKNFELESRVCNLRTLRGLCFFVVWSPELNQSRLGRRDFRPCTAGGGSSDQCLALLDLGRQKPAIFFGHLVSRPLAADGTFF